MGAYLLLEWAPADQSLAFDLIVFKWPLMVDRIDFTVRDALEIAVLNNDSYGREPTQRKHP